VESNLPFVLKAVCNTIGEKYSIPGSLTKIHMDHSSTEGLDLCGTNVQAPVYLTTSIANLCKCNRNEWWEDGEEGVSNDWRILRKQEYILKNALWKKHRLKYQPFEELTPCISVDSFQRFG
jgi:hypothetical protein